MDNIFDFASGLFAGWSQILVGQPFDYLKTKCQISAEKISTRLIKNFFNQITIKHGILGLYRGSSSLFFCFPFSIGIQFTVFEACKKFMMKRYHQHQVNIKTPQEVLSMTQIMISGLIVGATVSFVSCPIQYTKILRQTQKQNSRGSFGLLISQIQKGKFKRIYTGYPFSFLRETVGAGFYYSVYEGMVRIFCKLSNKNRTQSNFQQHFISGSLAGLTYWTVIYPIDVIKTRRQNGEKYNEILSNIRRSMYNGYSIMAFRSLLVNGCSFAVFQYMKSVFKFIDIILKF